MIIVEPLIVKNYVTFLRNVDILVSVVCTTKSEKTICSQGEVKSLEGERSPSFIKNIIMWKEERYNKAKAAYEQELKDKTITPGVLMMEYKRMIVNQDYEAAKAITEILQPLHFETSDTHRHIKELLIFK